MEGNTSIWESVKGWCCSARMESEGLHVQLCTRSCGAVHVGSISRCREVVSVMSLWLPQKKKINIKLEVSQHGEVVCFQLCGNIWHFPFSTLTHQLLDAGFFIHKYRNVILFILFLFLFLVDCQASNYGVILLHLLSRWTQPLGFHISVGSNCGWSRISPGLLALIISVCQRVRDSDSPVWR